MAEWAIVHNVSDPRRFVPPVRASDRVVLDVGCGSGQTLTAHEFRNVREKHGIDIDAGAIDRGRAAFPDLHLAVARAETLPYPSRTFDLVFSRLAWPYADIPAAAAEALRVLKPGGRLWVAMHVWGMEKERLVAALRDGQLRALFSRAPVLVNSIAQHISSRPLPLPKLVTRETFQTARGLRSILTRAGFTDITDTRTPTLIFSARRP
ncbi:MAG TPA: class I SAM-dependent methyltransferase [Hyphomicrobiaceae bacterium]|nr:class I SAM-dependent methyltransferase [Hyphomicrobiaceae bacterium]